MDWGTIIGLFIFGLILGAIPYALAMPVKSVDTAIHLRKIFRKIMYVYGVFAFFALFLFTEGVSAGIGGILFIIGEWVPLMKAYNKLGALIPKNVGPGV